MNRLADILRSVLRQEQILAQPSRPSLPPPHDLDSEAVVCHALLAGQATVKGLGLRAEHCYWPIVRAVVAVAESLEEMEQPATPDLIVGGIVRLGLGHDDVTGQLAKVVERAPVELPEVAAWAVKRAWKRRRILAAMSQIDYAWRDGQEAPVEAIEIVRRAFSKRTSASSAECATK